MSLEHGTTTNTCGSGSDHSATILLPTTAATGASVVVVVARMDLIASIVIMLYSEEGSLSYR
jgi:hypothetical protein